MSIKIIVDYDLCESNERCVDAAPEAFRVNEADELELLDGKPRLEMLTELRDAERSCPRGAITVVEE